MSRKCSSAVDSPPVICLQTEPYEYSEPATCTEVSLHDSATDAQRIAKLMRETRPKQIIDEEQVISPERSTDCELERISVKSQTRQNNHLIRVLRTNFKDGNKHSDESRRSRGDGLGSSFKTFQHFFGTPSNSHPSYVSPVNNMKLFVPVMVLLVLSFGQTLGCALSSSWYEGLMYWKGRQTKAMVAGTTVCQCDVSNACDVFTTCNSFQEVYGSFPGAIILMWAALVAVMLYSVATLLLLVYWYGDVFSTVLRLSVITVVLPLMSIPGIAMMEKWASANFIDGEYTRGRAMYIFISGSLCSFLVVAILTYTSCCFDHSGPGLNNPQPTLIHLDCDGTGVVDIVMSDCVVELSADGLTSTNFAHVSRSTVSRSVDGSSRSREGSLRSGESMSLKRLLWAKRPHTGPDMSGRSVDRSIRINFSSMLRPSSAASNDSVDSRTSSEPGPQDK